MTADPSVKALRAVRKLYQRGWLAMSIQDTVRRCHCCAKSHGGAAILIAMDEIVSQ